MTTKRSPWWWFGLRRRKAPPSADSDYADMGTTLGLNAWLDVAEPDDRQRHPSDRASNDSVCPSLPSRFLL